MEQLHHFLFSLIHLLWFSNVLQPSFYSLAELHGGGSQMGRDIIGGAEPNVMEADAEHREPPLTKTPLVPLNSRLAPSQASSPVVIVCRNLKQMRESGGGGVGWLLPSVFCTTVPRIKLILTLLISAAIQTGLSLCLIYTSWFYCGNLLPR